ncbi:restriction endonuclease subunit S [Phocaeicola plebeius]|uniref:restriction endonuclease subunit S n=1 Tax=Phocaeicola plebeius TaxID=310297 RepID=UPI0035217F3A
MIYQVSKKIDRNRIFIINRSEIEGRLDPKMTLYKKKVQHALYPMVKLKSLLLSKPQYGANEVGLIRNNNSQPRYIRITDIDENGLISKNDLGATVTNVEDKYVLNENDIVLARSGATVGKSYIHKQLPYTCLYAGYLIRFIVDAKKILPDYFFIYTQLNPYKEWVNAIQRPSAQPNINAEEYQSLEIPLPNLHKQKEIVEYLNAAYAQKLEKETESQILLKSINDYLLNELGIVIPNVDTALENRIFHFSYKNITGKRIDPKKYSPQVRSLYASIEASTYHKTELSTLISEYCSGDWGIEDDGNLHEDYIKCLTLRSTEIDNQYNIEINPDKVKYRLIKYDVYDKMSIAVNDIIIEKSGGSKDQPVGRVAIIDYDLLQRGNIAFSNFLLKIKVKDINPCYLYYYLKTMYNIGVTESMQSQTNGIRNLITDEFLSQTIVVPSLQKQQEIVDNITNIKNKAKALQQEGKDILESAKRNVERMIIGE